MYLIAVLTLMSAVASTDVQDLRQQARMLENEIDMKLISFCKIGAGYSNSIRSDSIDKVTSLSKQHMFESMALEIEKMLNQLADLNDKMTSELPPTVVPGTALHHTLQRHREILKDYKEEFLKIRSNYLSQRERESLLQSSHDDNYKSSSGYNRRLELYLKENEHIRSSDNLISDHLSLAMETRDNLVSQRTSLKRFQSRVNDVASRFPVINGLLQRINIRKRRDAIILGLVVGIGTLVLLMYAFW